MYIIPDLSELIIVCISAGISRFPIYHICPYFSVLPFPSCEKILDMLAALQHRLGSVPCVTDIHYLIPASPQCLAYDLRPN